MAKYNLTASDESGSVSFEAVLNRLGGIDGARRFLRGELEVREAEYNKVEIEAILNKLGGIDGARRFLRGEIEVREVVRRWVEEGGLFYVTVTSDGTTGEQWIVRLERQGFRLSKYARQLLRSPEFVPTSGVAYRVAVLSGAIFSDDDRVTSEIRAEAARRGFKTPHPEVACLLRETLSDADLEAMGLAWLAVMHEPIEGSDGDPDLLVLDRCDDGRWLCASDGRPNGRWDRVGGFAFVVPQAGPYR